MRSFQFAVLSFVLAAACGGSDKQDPELKKEREVSIVFAQQAILEFDLEVFVVPQGEEKDPEPDCQKNDHCIKATELLGSEEDEDGNKKPIGFQVTFAGENAKKEGAVFLISAIAREKTGDRKIVYKTADNLAPVTITPAKDGEGALRIQLVMQKVDIPITEQGVPSFSSRQSPAVAAPGAVVAIDFAVIHTNPKKTVTDDDVTGVASVDGTELVGAIVKNHPDTNAPSPGRLWLLAPDSPAVVDIVLTVTDEDGHTADASFKITISDATRDLIIDILDADINHGPMVKKVTIDAPEGPIVAGTAVTFTLDVDDIDGDEVKAVEWDGDGSDPYNGWAGEGENPWPIVCRGTFSDTLDGDVKKKIFTLQAPGGVKRDVEPPVMVPADPDPVELLFPPELLKDGGNLTIPLGSCLIIADVEDTRGGKGKLIFSFHPGAADNFNSGEDSTIEVVSTFDRDLRTNGAGGRPGNQPNGVAHDAQSSQAGDCGSSGTTKATLSHLQDANNLGEPVGTPFAGFSYSIEPNNNNNDTAEEQPAPCAGGEFAAAVIPFVNEGAKDISRFPTMRFSLKSLTGTPVQVRITFREADPRDCDGILNPIAESSDSYEAKPNEWTEYEIPIELSGAGLTPNSESCGLDETNIGSLAFKIDAVAPSEGHIGIDDIVFVEAN